MPRLDRDVARALDDRVCYDSIAWRGAGLSVIKCSTGLASILEHMPSCVAGGRKRAQIVTRWQSTTPEDRAITDASAGLCGYPVTGDTGAAASSRRDVLIRSCRVSLEGAAPVRSRLIFRVDENVHKLYY